MNKKLSRETRLLLFLGIPVIEMAMIGYLYLSAERDQTQLSTEIDFVETTVLSLPPVAGPDEIFSRESAIKQLELEQQDLKSRLDVDIVPADVCETILQLADKAGVTVLAVNSPGMTDRMMEDKQMNVLPLTVSIRGTPRTINRFAEQITEEFTTSVIDSLLMTMETTAGTNVITGADLSMDIYTYRRAQYVKS